MEKFNELIDIVELYAQGKVSAYALEKELAKTATKELFASAPVAVKITEEDSGAAHSSNIITTLPQMSNDTAYLTILIDKTLFEIVNAKQLVQLFINEVPNSQDALKIYSSFLLANSNDDIGVADCIEMFLDVYKGSVNSVYTSMPEEIIDLLSTAKVLPKMEKFKEAAEALGYERLEVAIEKIVGDGTLPLVLVKKAKEIASKLRSEYREQDSDNKLFTPFNPTQNAFQQQRELLVDGKYNAIKGKQIPYDYKPEGQQ